MFHNIPAKMIERMRYLESVDITDREDGTPQMDRLRQVPPETGKFIALLAASTPEGEIIEIGTSGGYSTLWLALACREMGRTLTTFEVLEEKAKIAEESFRLAGVTDIVKLVIGDAREHLPAYSQIAFCFLDAEKEIYSECYEMVVPNLVKGGILVADNAVNHQEILATMIERALTDERVNAMVVPVGKGELICWKR
jgi:predicted O-methyltransferase YrrM